MHRSYKKNIGFERARAHIQAYSKLERELGSIVSDIKIIFFNLPPDQLSLLFSRYGDIYKESAKQYAIETFHKWETGKRQMSGQTAERLLNLVPQFLSTEQRFYLVEKLCKEHALSETFYACLDLSNQTEGLYKIKAHLDFIRDQCVGLKYLPSHVTEKVKWLSDGDAVVARKTLNEFSYKEYRKCRELAAKEIGHLIELLESSELNINAQRIVKILNYTIAIDIKKPAPRKSFFQSLIEKIW